LVGRRFASLYGFAFTSIAAEVIAQESRPSLPTYSHRAILGCLLQGQAGLLRNWAELAQALSRFRAHIGLGVVPKDVNEYGDDFLVRCWIILAQLFRRTFALGIIFFRLDGHDELGDALGRVLFVPVEENSRRRRQGHGYRQCHGQDETAASHGMAPIS
jgi:hypothetical protein